VLLVVVGPGLERGGSSAVVCGRSGVGTWW
jgi:hypothetical protein